MPNPIDSFVTWFRDVQRTPWSKVSTPALVGCTVFGLVIWRLATSGDRWVPILDPANLMFHEAGHPLLGLFKASWMVYGGTIGQLAFPVISMGYFWQARHCASFFVATIWLMQNIWNISRYLADARAHVLPLVGGGDRLHDWFEILFRWNALASDLVIARRLDQAATAGCTLIYLWLVNQWLNGRVIRPT